MPTITFYNDFNNGQLSFLCQDLRLLSRSQRNNFGGAPLTIQDDHGTLANSFTRYLSKNQSDSSEHSSTFQRWSVLMFLISERFQIAKIFTNRNIFPTAAQSLWHLSDCGHQRSQGSHRLRHWLIVNSHEPTLRMFVLGFKRLTYRAIAEFNSAIHAYYPQDACVWVQQRISPPMFFNLSEVMMM